MLSSPRSRPVLQPRLALHGDSPEPAARHAHGIV